jgi:hypothetical protein
VVAHDHGIAESDLHFEPAPFRGRSDRRLQFADLLAILDAVGRGKSDDRQSLAGF